MHKIIAAYKNLKHTLQPYNNDRGFIMAVVIMLSLILLIIVTMAIWSTNNESHIVRNTGIMTQEFYDAESGIVGAINHHDMWLTTAFSTGASDESYAKLRVYSDGSVVVYDAHPGSTAGTAPTGERLIAEVQIRKIDNYVSSNPVRISALWDEANQYPDMDHVGSGGGGGTSGRYYVLTSKDAQNNNATIQVGVVQTITTP